MITRLRLWWKMRQLDKLSVDLWGRPGELGGFDLPPEDLSTMSEVEYPDNIVYVHDKKEWMVKRSA
jgi:hypothetical protein